MNENVSLPQKLRPQTITMKFGGTSVGSAEAILRVAGIIERTGDNTLHPTGSEPRGVAVIASAMSGVTNELMVASNGIVSVADGGPTTWTPNLTTALNSPVTAWYTWTDLSPNLTGSGQVYVEDTATNVYVIYDGVYHYGTSTPYYFELHFDKITGNVSMVFGPNSYTNNILVGFSTGGPSNDPGATDLSDPLVYPILIDRIPEPLALAADARPIMGTSFNLVTTEVPAAAILAGQVYGWADIPGGFDLTPFGMPGCFQHVTMDAVGTTVPGGASSFTFPFTVPNTPNLVGVHIFAQSAVLGTGGVNPLDAITSNGVDLMFDALSDERPDHGPAAAHAAGARR